MQQWEQREKVGPVESFGDRQRGQREPCNNIDAMYDCFFYWNLIVQLMYILQYNCAHDHLTPQKLTP
jgi:hypothetical protein